jgi:predicted nucleic acid-binding protein
MPSQRDRALLLLDACCLINLAATGLLDEILLRLPYACATSDLVISTEVLSVLSADGLEREPINASALSGLSIFSLSDEELVSFLEFAMDLDDGEASVCALAQSRGGTVATDDRKAIRILGGASPAIPILQTPDLLYEWQKISGSSHRELCEIVRAIEQRARFRPRRDHRLFSWWSGFS